jgi:plasmid stability protein
MATLTLKNVPNELYDRLKALATEHKRSLNQEAIACLEEAIRSSKTEDVRETLAALRRLRARMRDVFVTDADLAEARRAGRR